MLDRQLLLELQRIATALETLIKLIAPEVSQNMLGDKIMRVLEEFLAKNKR